MDDIAAMKLRGIAYDLQIPEGKVLRRGLAMMRYYFQAFKEDQAASLILRKGNTVSELMMI